MLAENHLVATADNHKIYLKKWLHHPSNPPRAIVHICHGMAEHCNRYLPVAEFLTAAGINVYAHDHRGHGHSITPGSLVGHYADQEGWAKVVRDIDTINEVIQSDFPGTPILLLGHSMGSFIAQAYCLANSANISGLILSGSTYNPVWVTAALKLLLKMEHLREGPFARSWLVSQATFVNFNRKVKSPRTDFDWLSRDSAEVDKYLSDPLCGFLCTNQLWLDMVNGMAQLAKRQSWQAVPKDLPMLLIAGERDPMSYHKKKHGVVALANHFIDAGFSQVNYRLYAGGRHEILNELNRAEVLDELLHWINARKLQPSNKSASSQSIKRKKEPA